MPKPRRRSNSALRCGAVLLLFVSATTATHAQDTNYWSTQFGTRAHLLGGAVVGSSDDLSAVYYNPGALALLEETELLLTAVGAENTWLTLEDAFGEGQDVTTSYFSGLPSLVAGELPFAFLGNTRLAYSVFARSVSEVRVRERGSLDTFPDAPEDLEAFTPELIIDQRVSDYWGGLTFAAPLGDRFGLGISTFVGVRNQRSRVQTTASLLASDNRGGLAFLADDFSYFHVRALWKIGVSTRLRQWRVGMAITTPSVKLFGSGDTSLDRTGFAQAFTPDDEAFSQFTSNIQEDLPSTFDSPLSISLGAARSFGDTRVHLSAEWFDSVGPFKILDSDPVFDLTTGEKFSTDVNYALKKVFNMAIGVEHHVSDRLELYGGFRTDFSGSVVDNNATISNWDIYHLSGGVTLVLGGSSITLGTVYAFGDAPTEARVDFVPTEPPSLGIASGKNLKYRKLTLLLGFQLFSGN